ncbi:MAG: rhodanese-like domain-containing protein [Haloferacaceae archaeon]
MADDWIERALSDLPPSAKLVYKVLEYNGRLSHQRLREETRLSSRTLRYAITNLEEADLVESRSALYDARQTCYTLAGDRSGGSHAGNALVDAEWVREHLPSFREDDPATRLLYVAADGTADALVPGSAVVGTESDLFDPSRQRLPTQSEVEEVLGDRGVTEDTQLVLYDDGRSYCAAYAYWILAYYGHAEQRLLDGGLDRWLGGGNPTTDTPASFTPVEYDVRGEFEFVRAHRDDVSRALSRDTALLDVRSPSEHRGERVEGGDLAALTNNPGHIPGATNVPWDTVFADDRRFAPADELEETFADAGVTTDREVIVYCGVGARSALVWFVLSELLGFPEARNYDGSWTEWANLVDAPIETN